jgi:hypothetical protein
VSARRDQTKILKSYELQDHANRSLYGFRGLTEVRRCREARTRALRTAHAPWMKLGQRGILNLDEAVAAVADPRTPS